MAMDSLCNGYFIANPIYLLCPRILPKMIYTGFENELIRLYRIIFIAPKNALELAADVVGIN